MELLEKLAALVPPRRFHLLRYHGVLGGPATAAASCLPNRLRSRRSRTAIPALRPAAIAWGGGIAEAVTLRMPVRVGGAAGGAPAEGSASAAVRVRRLTSSAIRSLRRERYGGMHPQVPG